MTADTIVAISTPPGRGGIGVVRLSGPGALSAALPMLDMAIPPAHARARFARVLDPASHDGEGRPFVLDEAVVTYFAAPHSYTGEDILEISTHGAPVVVEHVLRTAVAHGARLARPGEFTERAFLSGRLDLTQAEAVLDLVQASTLHQARTAAMQLGGSLAREIGPAKQQLVHLIAQLEAGIDFAEDDLDVISGTSLEEQIAAVVEPLLRLERTFGYGRILREGASLAIVGRPNAGKSSLFNALLERERSIVTSTPGTTRDLVTEQLAIDGIPITLTDTAGLREATDEAEQLGIVRSRESLAEASLVLLVLDATTSLHPEDEVLLRAEPRRPLVIARNKIDLLPEDTSSLPDATLVKAPKDVLGGDLPLVHTSARTGAGLPELRTAIRAALTANPEAGSTCAVVTSVRQHTALTEAVQALATARSAHQHRVPHEMVLLDLHRALRALDDISGVTTTDELLQHIFSTFCIGK